MEDDEDEMNLNDSSLYDLSPSLTRARRHSLTLQQNPSTSQSSPASSPYAPPSSSTLPSTPSSQVTRAQNEKIQARKPPANTSGLQTIPSGKVVSNFTNAPPQHSSVSFASDESSLAPEITEAPQDDVLRPLIGIINI